MRASHNVLLAHEDKTYSGAFVPRPRFPGASEGRRRPGRLPPGLDARHGADRDARCWPAAAPETARRALVYLACTQQPDGGFAQNFWVDGTPYWSGMQLDEVAFPIILAWRLVEGQRPGRLRYLSLRRAGGRLPGRARAHHPAGALGGERRLFAFDAGGGDRRADLRGGYRARARLRRSWPTSSRNTPTGSKRHLDEWTITNDGVLHPDVKHHYMRIRPPAPGEAFRLRKLRQGDHPHQQPRRRASARL